MVALQSRLNEVSSLVQRNIDLTSQIIENTRRDERARLMGLVDTVAQALEDAEAAGSVPRRCGTRLLGRRQISTRNVRSTARMSRPTSTRSQHRAYSSAANTCKPTPSPLFSTPLRCCRP